MASTRLDAEHGVIGRHIPAAGGYAESGRSGAATSPSTSPVQGQQIREIDFVALPRGLKRKTSITT